MMFDVVGPTCVAVGALTAATAAAATLYLTNIPEPNCVPLVDLNNQSEELEDGSRCSRLAPKGHFAHVPYDDVRTLHDCFIRGLKISKDKPCVGERKGPNLEYVWVTYQEVYDMTQAFGSWMLEQGIKPKMETIIGLYSQNRTEWTVTAQACSMFSLVPVALYDTLGHEASAFILNQTEMSLLVCDNAKKANMLIQAADDWPKLRQLVVMNGLDDVNQELAARKNIKLSSFAEAIKYGKENLKEPVPPEPEEICMICYTSGTTGNPKGAIMTHETFVADLAGCFAVLMPQRLYHENDIEISYLPLAHMYERIVQSSILCHGGRIGYFRGDPKLLVEDIQALRPSVLPMVPRLLNRIYDKPAHEIMVLIT